MRGKIWGFIKRFSAWLAGAAGAVFLLLRWFSDIVGRSTFYDDLKFALNLVKPVTTFFASQPEWLFYPLCFALLLAGLASAATRWAPILGRLGVGSSARQVGTNPIPALPDMGFGDLVRHIAADSAFAVSLGSATKWSVLIERELVDRLSHGHIVAFGRLMVPHRSEYGVAKLDAIDPTFWSGAELRLSKYFSEPEDSNVAKGLDGYGYRDLRVYRHKVMQVWPKKAVGESVKLDHLEEALAERQRVLTERN